MDISIPDTVKTYCASKENTQAMNVLIEAINKNKLFSEDSFEDYQKKCEVDLFVQKFKYDMWKFRYDLWKAVWGKLLEEKWPDLSDGSNAEEFSSTEDYDIVFYAICEIGQNKYYFTVSSVNGNDRDGQEIVIGASKVVEEAETSIIPADEIEQYSLVKIAEYENLDEYYTQSKCSVNVTTKGLIDDKAIKDFKEAAKSILGYIEKDLGVKAKKMTKGKK